MMACHLLLCDPHRKGIANRSLCVWRAQCRSDPHVLCDGSDFLFPFQEPVSLFVFHLIKVIGPFHALFDVIEHRFGRLEIDLEPLCIGARCPAEIMRGETLDRVPGQLFHTGKHPVTAFVPDRIVARSVDGEGREYPFVIRLHEGTSPRSERDFMFEGVFGAR